MPFVLVVVIALASGLACLSFLVIAAFCLLRQRMKDKRDLEDELGSLEDRLSPVKRIRSNPKIQKHHSRKMTGVGTKWPTVPPIVYEPTNSTHLNTMNPLDISSINVGFSQTGRSETTVSIYS